MPCQILHARHVFPVIGDPIENGFVTMDGEHIAAVGETPPRGECIELGNVALLPGFVNAHTHLEFSGLSQPLGKPGMGFVDWIREVIAWRQCHLLETDAALAAGVTECIRQGVTTFGNISQLGESEDAYDQSSADGIRFIEYIVSNYDRIVGMMGFLMRELPQRQQRKNAAAWQFGLSPHAPYSVDPGSLKCLVEYSAKLQAPLAMHLAESREEIQLLAESTGPFRNFLEERISSVAPGYFGGKRPLEYLKMLAGAQCALVIHGNYLDDAEIAYLADRAAKMAVVYCPRTHAYFRHDPYPLEKMLAAGATVALGTDSRASSPDLSLLAEMRYVAQHYPQVDKHRILKMGTIDAARALGREQEIGSLEPGKWANLAVVALPKGRSADPFRLLLESEGPVV